MQWTCQLVVKTGAPPDGGGKYPSTGGSTFVSGGVLRPYGWLDIPLCNVGLVQCPDSKGVSLCHLKILATTAIARELLLHF